MIIPGPAHARGAAPCAARKARQNELEFSSALAPGSSAHDETRRRLAQAQRGARPEHRTTRGAQQAGVAGSLAGEPTSSETRRVARV